METPFTSDQEKRLREIAAEEARKVALAQQNAFNRQQQRRMGR